MNEPQRPQQTTQGAPDATGGVSRTHEAGIGPVEKVSEPMEEKIASRREWTRIGLTIAFVVLFLIVFGTGAIGAFIGGETNDNTGELVNRTLPFVTALGGYVASFYFPQNGGRSGGP